MALIFRWLLRLATGLMVLVTAGLIFGYLFASRSLPEYDATERVPGLRAEVEIVRDNANVPHIFATNDHDAFYALGYAHAQDRLWQMIMLRRTVQGRLSELFGADTLPIDMLMRRLDLYGLSISSVEAQTPQARVMLEAYADGVNAWLGEINEGARGRGAPEMWLFNHAVAPWRPADSIAVAKLMAFQLSGHAANEVLRARASLMLPEARLADLMPDAPGSGIAALPDYAALVPGALPGLPDTRLALGPLSPLSERTLAGASNAWAAAPDRSATGSTLLANDPHLGLSAPSIWYLARMELQSGSVIGATIPGLPTVHAGRSEDLGWGVTASYLDDQDLFIEELNPANPEEYRTPDGWAPFASRESIIVVDGAAPVTITLRWTDNGPVLTPDQLDVGTVTPPGHVAALGWTALSAQDTSLSAGLALMTAPDIRSAVRASEGFIAPSFNLVLADRNEIAMKTIGAMPRRNAEHQSEGRLPTLGALIQNRWLGRMNFSANPEFIAPIGGILGNTNNKTLDRPFPAHVSHWWGDTQRINRWERLMQTREVHTRESFIEAQLDTVSFTARSLLPLVGADLWFTGAAAPPGSVERQRQDALALLAEWNGEMNEHLPEPLIYAAWMRALQERLIRDELGPLADGFTRPDPVFIERVFRNIDGAGGWCDVLQSAPVETCSDISRLALDAALVELGERYGSDVTAFRWGDAHQATHDHPVLGSVRVLNWFVNIRQSTSGGDNTLQRGRTIGTGPDPYLNVHAAGYRGVYDFANPDSSVFVIATGQSGHFLSRHYDDLGELWRRGEYIPMSLDPALARAAAVGVTRLIPDHQS